MNSNMLMIKMAHDNPELFGIMNKVDRLDHHFNTEILDIMRDMCSGGITMISKDDISKIYKYTFDYDECAKELKKCIENHNYYVPLRLL